jgi:hypothetical protein
MPYYVQFNIPHIRAARVAQVVEFLASKLKDLSSNLSTTKRKKNLHININIYIYISHIRSLKISRIGDNMGVQIRIPTLGNDLLLFRYHLAFCSYTYIP